MALLPLHIDLLCCCALFRRGVSLQLLPVQRDEAEGRAGVLATNISALYATAKLEIARKDDEIKELRGR